MSLTQLLIQSAKKFPEKVAVIDGKQSITYKELDALSNQMALKLIVLGIKKGDRVAIWAEKSYQVIAAMQATLRVGAAYVPIDPLCPEARARVILKDCDVRHVFTTNEKSRQHGLESDNAFSLIFIDDFKNQSFFQSKSVPVQEAHENDLAYILYTSGSTGVPKGICLSHKNALSFIHWAAEALEPKIDDRFSSHAPFHFDLSVLDIYVPLLTGGSVALVPEGLAYIPKKLVEFITNNKINYWYSVPSALILMMEKGSFLDVSFPFLKAICFAGEPFPIKHLRQIRNHLPKTRLLNLYGPTETNVCTYYEVNEIPDHQTSPVPIGKPCCGNEAWIQNPDDPHSKNPRTQGELVIRGPTVMLGYWGKAPIQTETYPTGDIVKLESDGNYSYIGRKDHQVKVKGFRIDLGEVETTLLKAPEIAEVAVIVLGAGLDSRLFACIRTKSDSPQLSLFEMKKLCAQYLPKYMIVDGFRTFSEFPRTSTGKTDRKKLYEELMKTENSDKIDLKSVA